MHTTRAIVVSLVLALTALAPAAALAKHGADDPPGADDKGDRRAGGTKATRVTGSCTGSATAKLKAKPDGGRLETEFEVDQNRNGVTWTVTIRRNGVRAVSTKATTKAPSGSFSVQRRLANGSGTDRIGARATSPSGQVCTASITV